LITANRGSLVVAGVEELSLQLQGRLSGALRARAIPGSDGAPPQPIRCRLVAIARVDLRSRVKANTFREDLFYRLDVQRLRVPSLHERRDDIPQLIDSLTRGQLLNIREDALKSLKSYAWPGNIRELSNEVKRLCANRTQQIIPLHLSEEVRSGQGVAGAAGAHGGKTLLEVEKAMVVAALTDSGGSKAQAARRLGIPRSTLYGLMDRYGLR
jgi:DNA-binding NtrC family response regulator